MNTEILSKSLIDSEITSINDSKCNIVWFDGEVCINFSFKLNC